MTLQQAGRLGGKATGRKNKAKTHCPHGYPYSGENLYIVPGRGWRQCRTCNRVAFRRRKRDE